jgi:NADPH:quinone reductase-like Zn-dependent oxidoreductase
MEQGAMMLVNPLTAWALVDVARRGRHRAIVQTAAASAFGKMVLKLGAEVLDTGDQRRPSIRTG